MKKNVKLGLGLLTVLATPLAVNAVDGQEVQAATTGWVQSGNTWYYVNKEGLAVKNAWIGSYWVGADGKMATNSWVDNGRYYVGADGKWDKNAKKPEEKKVGWKKENNAWYYYNNGTIAKNTWSGNYWLGADGKMVINAWVDNGRYYVGTDGAWVKDKKKEEKKVGWKKENNSWYYYDDAGNVVKGRWLGDYYLKSDGKMASNEWFYDNNYKAWYYLQVDGSYAANRWVGEYWVGADGKMATNTRVDNNKYYVGTDGKKVKEEKKVGWQKENNTWYYYDNAGNIVKGKWVGDYYLKADGKMASNEWFYDNNYKAYYFLQTDGSYAANRWVGEYWVGADGKMATNTWVDNNRYYVGSDGKWVKNTTTAQSNVYAGYYKVTALYAPIYNASGQVLSNVSRDTVVFRTNGATSNGRIPVESAGLKGYMNTSQLKAVSEAETPYYISDGKYVYHKYPNASVAVAYHNANMQVGKKYYSADGINFGTFKLDHPFQFMNLKSKTNYTASDLNRLYNLMGASDSKLAGKGATFKAAEARYGVNALYLVAHSALESAWGKSKIAKDKNNFFGISAYDNNPYNAATKFDNVDAGILGAARWINERYLATSSYPARGAYLGNKAGGMNVNYATAPYWGESIASIMFNANDKLGRKDK